jgi:nitroreductase
VTTTESDATSTESHRQPGTYASDGEAALKVIYGRRAVRSYTDQPVSREDVERLLDAAIHAPSAVNSQPWAFVVIQEPGLLTRYADEGRTLLQSEPPAVEIAHSAPTEIQRFREMAADEEFQLFHGAPTLIVIYATSIHGVPDCFLAAENLMLAARAIGLATCPIGLASPLFNQAPVKAELQVPADWPVALTIAVGWPVSETPLIPRHPVKVVAWR